MDQIEFRERLAQIPNQPTDADGPVFDEPWQATVFSMVVALHDRGDFVWRDWVDVFGEEIARGETYGASDHNTIYYNQMLTALERMMISERAHFSQDELEECKEQWRCADAARPHGEPHDLGAFRQKAH